MSGHIVFADVQAYTVISPAEMVTNVRNMLIGRSCMYNRKRFEPKSEPWGMSALITWDGKTGR